MTFDPHDVARRAHGIINQAMANAAQQRDQEWQVHLARQAQAAAYANAAAQEQDRQRRSQALYERAVSEQQKLRSKRWHPGTQQEQIRKIDELVNGINETYGVDDRDAAVVAGLADHRLAMMAQDALAYSDLRRQALAAQPAFEEEQRKRGEGAQRPDSSGWPKRTTDPQAPAGPRLK